MRKKLALLLALCLSIQLTVGTILVAEAQEKDNSQSDAEVQEISKEADNLADALEDATEVYTKTVESNYARSGVLTVVLDPGHDNTHQGANHNNVKEADLNLRIAQYCKAELEQYSGVVVYLTRDSQDCPYPGTSSVDDNHNRTAMAGNVGADIYVSIHCNSVGRTGNHGAEVYYPNENYNPGTSTIGKGVSGAILNFLTSLGIYNGGLHIRNTEDGSRYPDGSYSDYYGVIRTSKLQGIPGIIVEHAYVSSASDVNQFLNSDDKLKRLGIADANGIAQYYGLLRGNQYYFDAKYYYDRYPDLQQAIGYNPEKLLEHFQSNGMAEGRQGCASFNVYSYKNRYADLRNMYGNNLPKYYQHYLQYGLREGRVGTGYENTIVDEPVAPEGQAYMFRLYNPNSGEHFYTASADEKYHLITVGWSYEGIGWTAPQTGYPVYRIYNPNAGDHHYTMDYHEKETLVWCGWKDEGIAFYSDVNQTIPLYRAYNPNAKAGAHNYTVDYEENSHICSLGWRGEGVAWYGVN